MKHAFRRHGVVIAIAVAASAIVFFLNTHAEDGNGNGNAGAELRADAGHAAAAAMPMTTDGASVRHPGSVGSPTSGSTVVPAGLPPVDPVDPPEYATGLPLDTLYAPEPAARAHFKDKLPFGVDDRSYIEFNRGALAALDAGSVINLRTPDDGRQHSIRIDEIQVHPNGDKSWVGHVQDAGGEVLSAVFTQGVDSSLGSFSTTSGTYSFEAEGRLGWIANIGNLRQHQDFSQPDVMTPDPDAGKRTPGQH